MTEITTLPQLVPLAIETAGLFKIYGANRAVDGIDLRVRQGSIFGLLGPNGAGKTTVVRLLATLIPPDGGSAKVFGHDVVREAEKVRRRISLTGQFASVDEDLTGLENLLLLARLIGYSRRHARSSAEELLHAFDLEEAARRRVKGYSGGMRRRLDLAASILSMPDLLFLDEPTTGLDPRSRNHLWTVLRTLVADGTTILLTTQYLEEADQLADRIAVIDHGRVIAEGTSAELKALAGSSVLHVRLSDPDQREAARQVLDHQLNAPIHLEADPRALAVQVSDPDKAAMALAALPPAGIAVTSYSLGQPSLEEVFFALTAHGAVEREVDADGDLGSLVEELA
jgi:ABC-2 type transport system ATP-binding protein